MHKASDLKCASNLSHLISHALVTLECLPQPKRCFNEVTPSHAQSVKTIRTVRSKRCFAVGLCISNVSKTAEH